MTGWFWPTDKLHVAKLLAVKQTVVTVSKWPRPGDQKTTNFVVVNVSFELFIDYWNVNQ